MRLPRKTQPQLATIVLDVRVVLDQRQRQQAEAAGDEIETEQHDEDESDREDQRADQRLPGLHRAGDGKTCRRAEDGARKPAADDQVEARQRELAAPGIDHGGSDVGRLYVIHVPAPVRKAGRNGVTALDGPNALLPQCSKRRARGGTICFY